jgi:hypothetical protein
MPKSAAASDWPASPRTIIIAVTAKVLARKAAGKT